MNTVRATMTIEVYAECPDCGNVMDIMNDLDGEGHNHNEEGKVISQACPDGHWIDKHEEFEIKNITCKECEKDFNISGLEW